MPDPSGPSRASTPAGGAQPVGRPLPGWAPRDALAPTVLEGETVRLRPLTTDDADDFFAALDGPDLPRELFTYLMTEPPADATEMRDIIRAALAAPASWPLAIVVDEQVVGMASYLRIDPAIGSAEVGNILYSPALQRTTAATEAMHLMAAHAFEQGYRRYEWKCDALNAPSRAAARRLGFVEEGTFRNALVCKGRNRDTTWFSITDDEWPAVAAAHRAWLDEARAGTPSPLADHLRR